MGWFMSMVSGSLTMPSVVNDLRVGIASFTGIGLGDNPGLAKDYVTMGTKSDADFFGDMHSFLDRNALDSE